MEIAEDRLKLWDKSEGCALFQSGMAAITTTILELTRPNTLILHSSPLYGGTDHFIEEVLPKYNIKSMYFDSMKSLKSIIEKKNKEEQAKITEEMTKLDADKQKEDIQTKQKIDWKEPK